jgi:hypothetical protein
LWDTAAIVIAATIAGGAADARAWVYRAAAGRVVALGVLTALTGAHRGGVVQDLSGGPCWR